MKATGMGRDLRRLSSDITTRYISESGTKKSNKDYFGFIPLDGYMCWAIAETYDNDDVSSAKIAVETVLNLFSQKPTLSKRKLRSYVDEANRQMFAQSGQFQRKASILVVASNYTKIRYAQCGDCRFYIFRNGNVLLRSDDQSLMGSMIKEGVIEEDDEQGKEESRNLLSYLGQKSKVNVFVSKKIVLLDNDILLLATWGLWYNLITLEMLDVLEGADTADKYLEELQELLLSKQEEGTLRRGRRRRIVSNVDNYTAAAIYVNKTFVEASNARRYMKIALMILIPLLIIGLIWGIIMIRRNVIRNGVIRDIEQFVRQGDIYFADQSFNRAFIEYENGVNESRKLTGVWRRRVAQNLAIREAATNRARVAQLIIDGEEHFNAGRYGDARSHFLRGMQTARIDIDLYDILDNEVIENWISRSDDHAYINSLVTLGNIQADLGLYADALMHLNEARDLAVRIGYRSALDTIRMRIMEITSRAAAANDELARQTAEAEQRTRDDNIQRIEHNILAADIAFASGDIATAKSLYEEAIRDFITFGEVARASATQHKLRDMQNQHQITLDNAAVQAIEMFVLEGDRAMANSDFARALEIFEQAAWDYIVLGEISSAAALQYRIIDAGARLRSDTLERVTRELELAVLEGDAAIAEGDFDRAILIFEQAGRDFIEVGDTAMATNMRFRVIDAETSRDQELLRFEAESAIRLGNLYMLGGDEHLAANERDQALAFFNLALTQFSQAREIFLRMNAFDRATAVQERMNAANGEIGLLSQAMVN